jgi:hypothetical protein
MKVKECSIKKFITSGAIGSQLDSTLPICSINRIIKLDRVILGSLSGGFIFIVYENGNIIFESTISQATSTQPSFAQVIEFNYLVPQGSVLTFTLLNGTGAIATYGYIVIYSEEIHD